MNKYTWHWTNDDGVNKAIVGYGDDEPDAYSRLQPDQRHAIDEYSEYCIESEAD